MAARIATSVKRPASKTKPAAKASAKKGKPTPAKSSAKQALKKPGAPASKAKRAAPRAKAPAKQPALAVRRGGKPKGVASRARSLARLESTPARVARRTQAMKQVIAEVFTPAANGSHVVEAYLREVDHPFKAEMEAVRAIILGVSPKISERIKWNAPSFYYKEDLGAFNPRANEFAHLILLFPGGAGIPSKGSLLEGAHKDRREAKFHSLADVAAKKPALEKLIRNWLVLRDS